MIFDTVLERLRASVARGGPDLAFNVQQLVAEVQAIVAQLVDPGSLGQLVDQLVVTVQDLVGAVGDPGPLVQTALALIDAVTGLVNKNDLLALAQALVTTVEDIVGGIDVTGVVGGLITAVEDVVARTVNPSEIVATVESVLNYLDQIVAGIDAGPYVAAAQQLAAETLIIVSNLERAAAACANGSNPTCAAVLALVDQEAAFVSSCASGSDPTCASVKSLVLAVVASGVAAATSCASLNDQTCGPLERAAVAAAGEAIGRAQACAAQNDPTCRSAVDAAKALLQSAGTCTNGLGVGALATGTSPTVDLTSTCAYVGSTVVTTVNDVLAIAQQCAAQTYPACAAAVQAVKDAAATAGACVNQFDPACAAARQAVTDAVSAASEADPFGMAEEAAADNADEATCLQAAAAYTASASPTTVRVAYTCLDELITFTVSGAVGDAVDIAYRLAPGVGMVGEPLTDEALAALAAVPNHNDVAPAALAGSPAFGGEDPPYEPDRRVVRDEFNGLTYKNLWYGDYDCNTQCQARFKSVIRIVHAVSLGQQKRQTYRMDWREMNNRSVTFQFPVRARHVDGWGEDETDDSLAFGPEPYYDDSGQYTAYIDTPRTGKYFIEGYNMVINDMQYGRFKAWSTTQTPRFKCYKKWCKFPNGREA